MRFLDPKSKQLRYGIVCHDAGSANVLFAWLKLESAPKHVYALGPALGILNSEEQIRSKCILVDSIESLVKSVDLIITGTGWQSQTEVKGIQCAHQMGKKCIAVIDHWTNYRERFYLDDKYILPNEIWVTDKWALKIATKEFPSIPIKLQNNAYAAEIVSQIKSYAEISDRLLYVGEPLRNTITSIEHPELIAFQYFVDNARSLHLDLSKLNIHLKPHPSQSKNFYEPWTAYFPNLKILNSGYPLEEAIGKAKIIVGLNSYALALAVKANKMTISALPPWAKPCSIPFPEIIQLS